MPRSFWKGSISFGLVNLPVAPYPAEESNELSFNQLDRRDLNPIGYKRINKATENEVPIRISSMPTSRRRRRSTWWDSSRRSKSRRARRADGALPWD